MRHAQAADGADGEKKAEETGTETEDPIKIEDTEHNLLTLLDPVEEMLGDLNVAEAAHDMGITRVVMDILVL